MLIRIFKIIAKIPQKKGKCLFLNFLFKFLKTISANFFVDYKISNIDLFFDDKNNIPREVRAAGLPFSLFINQEGKQIAKLIGPAEWDSIYFKDFVNSNLN